MDCHTYECFCLFLNIDKTPEMYMNWCIYAVSIYTHINRYGKMYYRNVQNTIQYIRMIR